LCMKKRKGRGPQVVPLCTGRGQLAIFKDRKREKMKKGAEPNARGETKVQLLKRGNRQKRADTN